MKLLIFVGINLGGAVGWWLGESGGLLVAFLLSGVGSIVGVWLGWLAARRLLE